MSYYAQQRGYEGQWCESPLEVVRWLCDLFGWQFAEVYESLLNQIEKMTENHHHLIIIRPLVHEDLALEIHNYACNSRS